MKNNFKIGTDIIEVHRINKLIENYNYNFFNKIFTEREVKWCLSKKYPQIHFSGRFAAKEAIKKALFGYGEDLVSFKSIEILREINKPPYVNLSFSNSNKYSCEITISHTHQYATAVAVIFIK